MDLLQKQVRKLTGLVQEQGKELQRLSKQNAALEAQVE